MGSENKNGKVPLISKIAYGLGDVGAIRHVERVGRSLLGYMIN